jgi:Plant PDR ABC transporter associated
VQVLKSRGIFPEAKWYWIGVGALIGFVFLFNALYTLALTYLKRKTLDTFLFHTKIISLTHLFSAVYVGT